MHQQVRRQRKGTLGIVLASKPAVTGCAASAARNSIFINRVYPGLTLVCKAFEGFGEVLSLVWYYGPAECAGRSHATAPNLQQKQSGRRLGLTVRIYREIILD